MKTLVRAAVIVLPLTGSAAYTQINHHGSTVLTARVNSRPAPMCPPDDPNGCGIYK